MPSERIQRQVDRLLDEAEQTAFARDRALVRERSEEILALEQDNADARALLNFAQLRLRPATGPNSPPRQHQPTPPLPSARGRGSG